MAVAFVDYQCKSKSLTSLSTGRCGERPGRELDSGHPGWQSEILPAQCANLVLLITLVVAKKLVNTAVLDTNPHIFVDYELRLGLAFK